MPCFAVAAVYGGEQNGLNQYIIPASKRRNNINRRKDI